MLLRFPPKVLIVSIILFLAALGPPQARADFMLGSAANYGLLFEGNGGNTLMFNNSNENGNVGIGNNGMAQLNGPGTITGSPNTATNPLNAINFSAANTGQYSNSGVTITPPGTVHYGVSDVTSALTTVNTLSQTLGLESGTSLTISSGGSVNASSGKTDVSGNQVFTLSNASNFPNGTFTIKGDGTQDVVINIPFSFSLNGNILLSGGITSDQVLFNFTPDPTSSSYASDYTSLSGGPTMTISTNTDPSSLPIGIATSGVFLDPTGAIQVNHSVVDGRVIGGDTHNLAFVSGANLNAPLGPNIVGVPAPSSSVLFGLGGLGFAGFLAFSRRRRMALAA